eukprot:TRINITY_DN11371_c0_g1_i1.p3 TRINITY_DN11371_c0_g1~~TRINITY_DN11371_c0_g1_i1.p3  ORF type:complete len:240 (-),score=75.39 TRINITY_DN11371_c0_g1_i1:36-755(-)
MPPPSSWRGQSWNPDAVAALWRVARDPRLAMPHLAVPHLGRLDFRALHRSGIRGVVLDKDNTLTAPYQDVVHPAVRDGFARCRAAFPNGAVCILSNSAGTDNDDGYESAKATEQALGLPVVRHRSKKPAGFPETLAFLQSALPDLQAHELCVIGDRVLTDVVFGNLHGALTVHTQPLSTRGDNLVARILRPVEGALVHLLRWVFRLSAPSHRLVPPAALPDLLLRDQGPTPTATAPPHG